MASLIFPALRPRAGLMLAAWMGVSTIAYAEAPIPPGQALSATPAVDSARAQLVAARRAVISSGLSGKIDTLPFREGDRFKKGDVLVAYDCALNRARLERAVLAESAARKKQAVAEQLEVLKSISRSDVEQARATVAVARAESSAERVLVDRCTITAPFAGRVGETYARAAESVAEGEKLVSIYDDSAFELEAIVPSRWLAWLTPGSPLRITVDETGRTYEAAVSHIAGAVDPVSQSVKIIGRLEDKQSASVDLLPGMSGSVRVDLPGSGAP
ncbi:efflux RND transporter periplasmic adaptor subunit [Achromobacter seleniivolatilans]|uniref:Efflux RND transporter periplasmic adaptor subunit n=1 Tax=Achromobacter seleniivolatilans TaxID=3047478 RepID=A0ABY9LW21_9BURK|nr:efflux RND transporter periplasmic adaptor subunit [Achromobacter sp. R39]WMD18983.1 efflux RND transporter periplasmic adaptor subunit [Achromobacter sp. R39]